MKSFNHQFKEQKKTLTEQVIFYRKNILTHKMQAFYKAFEKKGKWNEKKNINNEKTLNFLACINQNIYSDSLIELIPLYYNYY